MRCFHLAADCDRLFGSRQLAGSMTKEAGGEIDHRADQELANFECNICLDTAKDAVISMCGHLFCWGCLHQWLETKPYRPVCPVCKAAIGRSRVIPLYGRGGSESDPRGKVPPRPQGQWIEPEAGFSADGESLPLDPAETNDTLFPAPFDLEAFLSGISGEPSRDGVPASATGGRSSGVSLEVRMRNQTITRLFLCFVCVFLSWLFQPIRY